MPIYCDESGYTGINLLTEQQPYFVYAALNVTESDATNFQEHLRLTHRLQGAELKGTNLLGSNSGKRAILELFSKYSDQVKISYYHKKYALACKFFEYIFEPVLADNNALFYRMKFQHFIANLIFEAFQHKHEDASDVFLHFQELLRGNAGNFCILPQPERYLLPGSLEFAFGITTLKKLAQFSVKNKNQVLRLFITDLQKKVGAYRRKLKKDES